MALTTFRTSVRRAIALTAALLVGASGLLVFPGVASADPIEPTLGVLQWNIAGATFNPLDPHEPSNAGTFNVASQLVAEAALAHPSLISMNEACLQQAQFVAGALDLIFGSVALQFADSAGFQAFCPLGAGNALIAVGARSVWERQTFYFHSDGEITNEKTPRSATCMLVDFSSISHIIRACSLHLDANDPTAELQARSFANFMTENGIPYPLVLIGDFNAVPDPFLHPVYAPNEGGEGDFDEVDFPQKRDTEAEGKLDYIFGDQVHFVPQTTADVIDGGTCSSILEAHPCSDHKMLFGTLTLRPDVPVTPPPAEPPESVPPSAPTDMPPFVAAGPPAEGDEGATIPLNGSADDDHGPPSLTWSYRVGPDVDAGATCSFSDAHAARTTITCTDDGTFIATLTASDGVNDPVSASTTVTLRNVAPILNLLAPAPWQVFRKGTMVDLIVPFTDPGANDTHTCDINWDDGTSDVFLPGAGNRCDRTHTFTRPGMFTIQATVTDDDGGVGQVSVLVIVYDPSAGFETGGIQFESPAGAVMAAPGATGTARSEFNVQYRPGEAGPEPTGGKVGFRLADNFELDSTRLEWLVVTPDNKVAIKGVATVAGQPGAYGFVLYAYDAEPDAYRLVAWPLASGANPEQARVFVYDNRPGESFDLDEASPQPVTAGSINIHR